jgi:biopolymer transport protein ExbD
VNLSKQRGSGDTKLELQIAPLIDVVFLLLIYFMVTASLIKKEGDISFILPATANPDTQIDLPVEVLIEINEDGTVVLEGMHFDVEDRLLNDLAGQVRGLKQVAASQQSPFFVNLLPDQKAHHSRIIDVMDACAAAEVKSLTFSKSM